MSVAMIGPKFYAWDKNGKPLAFGKLYTYQARTNSPKDTYQSEDQQVANSNPVILNGEGYANVYLDGSYKMVLKDSNENEIWSSDPVTSSSPEEWVNCHAANYVSPTSLTIAGNVTDKYDVGRSVRFDNLTNFSYAVIDTSIYSGGNTVLTFSQGFVPTGIVNICASIIGVESTGFIADIQANAQAIEANALAITANEEEIERIDTENVTRDADTLALQQHDTVQDGEIDALQANDAIQDSNITALQAGQGAGVIGYATLAELNADLAHDAGTVGYVTNNTPTTANGTYLKVGASGVGFWSQSSGTIPLNSVTRAELAADFSFNGEIPASTDLDTVKDDGNYYGAPSAGYTNLPSDFGTGNFNLYVNEGFNGAGTFVFQRLINFNNANEKWVRRIGSDWIREYQNERMLTKGELGDGLSLRVANEDGNYLLPSTNTYLDMPVGAPASDFVLKVNDGFLATPGTFIQQRLESSSNPNEAWVRRMNTSGADGQPWTKSTSGSSATGRDQLTDYFDGSADITSGSVNDVTSSGVYLVPDANSITDLPVGAASGILEVRQNDDGGWGYQEYTNLFVATLKQRRMIRSGFTPEPWQGMAASEKIIACFGDSITENGTYPQQLAQMIGGSVLRMGFGGCRMANHEDSGYNAMCMNNISQDIFDNDYTALIAGAIDVRDRLGDDNVTQAELVRDTDWNTVDYVILFWGTNDYAANVPLGTTSDSTGGTFLGAINKTVANLLGAYPNLKILLVTPFWRPRIIGGDGKESDNFPNDNGDFLIEFGDAIIERSNYHHLDYFDFYRTGSIGPLTQHEYLGAGDDIHPKAPEGYTHVAERIAASFKSKFR